ncbi:MAG: zinc ribbon domain-containing protein [Alphaproteobacteria bacterium]|nr:zinc ribbon domain-containing protein [Alphaproteobacteria bacterium]
MFCENCGNSLKETAKFCSKCGTAVAAQEEEASGPLDRPPSSGPDGMLVQSWPLR